MKISGYKGLFSLLLSAILYYVFCLLGTNGKERQSSSFIAGYSVEFAPVSFPTI